MTISNSNNLFWDSCVVGRFLTEKPIDCVADIGTFITEAKSKKTTIYASTMIIVEVRPDQLKQKGYGDFGDLMKDLEGCLHLIGPTPPILMQVARLTGISQHELRPDIWHDAGLSR